MNSRNLYVNRMPYDTNGSQWYTEMLMKILNFYMHNLDFSFD